MFLINRGEITKRIDPIYYCNELFGFLKTTQYAIKKISDIAVSLKSGFGAGKQDQEQEGNGILQIRPTNVGSEGNLKFDKNVYLPLNLLETQQNNFLQKGDVLFNNTNSQEWVGKTAFFNEDGNFLFSNHITRIRTKNDVLPQFLVLLLNTLHSKKLFYSICTNWNNQSGVGIELLRSLKIPVPPLEIQAEIIAVFETAYNSKKQKGAEASQLLASIDGYLLEALEITLPLPSEKKTFFNVSSSEINSERFDPYYHQSEFKDLELALINGKYEIKSFRKLAKKITSGTTPKAGGDDYTNRNLGVPFIRSGEINEFDEIDLNDVVFIKPDTHNRALKSSQLKKNDLMIAIVGATIGQVGIFKYDFEANINQAIALVRFNDSISVEFVKSFLKTTIGQKILDKLKRPVARANINLEEIASIKIPLPPLEKQTEISDHISALRLQAKQLQHEARVELERAKSEVERMILGEK